MGARVCSDDMGVYGDDMGVYGDDMGVCGDGTRVCGDGTGSMVTVWGDHEVTTVRGVWREEGYPEHGAEWDGRGVYDDCMAVYGDGTGVYGDGMGGWLRMDQEHERGAFHTEMDDVELWTAHEDAAG